MDAIETQLDALESVGLVELYQTEPELEYLFRHVLIQEAAYASMVRHERRRLHHLVGEVLERRYVAGQRELAAVLALHFEQAGDQNQALDYLVAAAEYALEPPRCCPRAPPTRKRCVDGHWFTCDEPKRARTACH